MALKIALKMPPLFSRCSE